VKQIVLNIKDSKFQFFLELIKNLDFVKIEQVDDGDSKESIVNNLSEGFKELKQYKQGKLKTTSAKDFLNEL
jgi:hypothetical protein